MRPFINLLNTFNIAGMRRNLKSWHFGEHMDFLQVFSNWTVHTIYAVALGNCFSIDFAIQSNSNLLSCRLISAPLNFKLKLFPKDCQAQVFEYFSINVSDRSSIAQLFVYFLETVVSFLPSLFIVSSDIFAFCNLYLLILVQELYRWRWSRCWCVSLKR